MRKTKIVCTIGPACNDENTLMELCLAGMNVARLNFSHGTHEDHLKNINLIKKVREKLGLPIAILLDTKGPEYRIKTFKNGKIFLNQGDTFTFTSEDIIGDDERVSATITRDAPSVNDKGELRFKSRKDQALIEIYNKLVALGQEEKIGQTREDKGYDKVSYPRTINIRGNK